MLIKMWIEITRSLNISIHLDPESDPDLDLDLLKVFLPK